MIISTQHRGRENARSPITHTADEAVPARKAGRASRPRPLCILVVNDFEGAALALARLLEREGYVVLTAGSATEALESPRACGWTCS